MTTTDAERLTIDEVGDSEYVAVTDSNGRTVWFEQSSLVVYYVGPQSSVPIAEADEYRGDTEPWRQLTEYRAYGWRFDPMFTDFDIDEYLVDGIDASTDSDDDATHRRLDDGSSSDSRSESAKPSSASADDLASTTTRHRDADRDGWVTVTDPYGNDAILEESSLVVKADSLLPQADFVAYADAFHESGVRPFTTPYDEDREYGRSFSADGVDFDIDEYLVDDGDDDADDGETEYLEITNKIDNTMLFEESSAVIREVADGITHDYVVYADDYVVPCTISPSFVKPIDVRDRDDAHGAYKWFFDADGVDFDIDEYLVDDSDDDATHRRQDDGSSTTTRHSHDRASNGRDTDRSSRSATCHSNDDDESEYITLTDAHGRSVALDKQSLVVRQYPVTPSDDYVGYADEYIACGDGDAWPASDGPREYGWYFTSDEVDFDVDEYLVDDEDDEDDSDDEDTEGDSHVIIDDDTWLDRDQTVHHAIVTDGDTLPTYVSILETRHVATPSGDDRLHIWYTTSGETQ